MIAMLVLGTACTTQAQDDDKRIKIKITKEVDGERKTFEGEYSSEEEMRNDPAYQDFAGEDDDTFVWFDSDDDFDKIIELHPGQGASAFSFRFDDDDFPKNFKRQFRFHQGGPGAYFFGDDDAVIDLRGFDGGKFEEELEAKMKELEEKLEGVDRDLREEIMEQLRDIEDLHGSMGFPKRIRRDGISIEDAGDDFGKRGKVDEKDMLDADDMNFMVMRDQLHVRFRVKKEGELTVKISNEEGKDIYNRYFENYGGTFSDRIDFSRYEDGKYLLEIELDKKRLTKKIVID